MHSYTTEKKKDSNGKDALIYVCSVPNCGKEFMRTNNIIDHLRMHAGIKPFSCKFCFKSFTQKSNMKKHMKTHIMPALEQRKRYS
jgi:uncharacterized Zn-finger protein